MLNSENIERYEKDIINDIKIQYKNKHQNILNCNNIYYEEIKKTKDKRNIKIFLFITCENKNINIKIDNCISLLKEKINEQNIDIKTNTSVYRNYKIIIDNQNLNHNLQPKNLYYIIFPLAVKTNNYFNFLKKFNKEYKEKFKDKLFDDKKNKIFFNKNINICGLRLPYFIYPDKKKNYYNIYLSSSFKGNSSDNKLIKILKCKTDILIESEKINCIQEQDSKVKEIYNVYCNIFKDKIKYKKKENNKNGIEYEDIKIVINDYENNEVEIKGKNNIIYKDNLHNNNFDKDKFVSILEFRIKCFQEIIISMNKYNLDKKEDVNKNLNEQKEYLEKIKTIINNFESKTKQYIINNSELKIQINYLYEIKTIINKTIAYQDIADKIEIQIKHLEKIKTIMDDEYNSNINQHIIDNLEFQIKHLEEIKTIMDKYNFDKIKDITDKINEMEKEKKYVLNLFNK